MHRFARLTAASLASVIVVCGCSTGGPRYHDKLICQMLARAVSAAESSGRAMQWYSALTHGQEAALRRGYLSPRLGSDITVVITTEASTERKVRAALAGLTADCQAVGVNGPVGLRSAISE